jgi:hypothetical protein
VTIQEGSKVRVAFEGEYANKTIQDNHNIRTGGDKWNPGPTFTVPKGAKIEVLEKPVPKEPAVGSVIQFEDGALFARVVAFDANWTYINRASMYATYWFDWARVVKEHGSKFTFWGKDILGDVKPMADGESVTLEGCCNMSDYTITYDKSNPMFSAQDNHGFADESAFVDSIKRILKTVV